MSKEWKQISKNEWVKALTDKEWLEELAESFLQPQEVLEKDKPEGTMVLTLSATLCHQIGEKLLEIASRM
ncbi:hypothetical protein [Parageobacillus galactosidasius]|uniref:Uncharacterized protein n=1 Tax=Parageobacillus galactosidasius TaxID=883812 RepID=A0A226QT21_9BACL|nr:hypothetical protein [Parageobacillus galactosidasius]OXB94740.1 hypothetical protein B9L23_07705 [Parageobacillus galactosidasius]